MHNPTKTKGRHAALMSPGPTKGLRRAKMTYGGNSPICFSREAFRF